LYHHSIIRAKEIKPMDWDSFFKAMIAEEYAAKAKYAAAAAQASDPKLKELLEQFQYEEGVHADLLEGEYAKWRK
jgi:rubrerythrin